MIPNLFPPFSTIDDLANVSSVSTSSLIIVITLMEPSTFLTVNLTSVPFGPLIFLTTSSNRIPATSIRSSFVNALQFLQKFRSYLHQIFLYHQVKNRKYVDQSVLQLNLKR